MLYQSSPVRFIWYSFRHKAPIYVQVLQVVSFNQYLRPNQVNTFRTAPLISTELSAWSEVGWQGLGAGAKGNGSQYCQEEESGHSCFPCRTFVRKYIILIGCLRNDTVIPHCEPYKLQPNNNHVHNENTSRSVHPAATHPTDPVILEVRVALVTRTLLTAVAPKLCWSELKTLIHVVIAYCYSWRNL